MYTSASNRKGWLQNKEVYMDTHGGVVPSRQIPFIFCPKMKISCRHLLLFVAGYDLGAQAVTYDVPSLPSRACHIDSYSRDTVVKRSVSSFRLTQEYTWSIPSGHLHWNQGLLFPLCTLFHFPIIPFLSAFILKQKSQRQKTFSGNLEKNRRNSGQQRKIHIIHSTGLAWWRLISHVALLPV